MSYLLIFYRLLLIFFLDSFILFVQIFVLYTIAHVCMNFFTCKIEKLYRLILVFLLTIPNVVWISEGFGGPLCSYLLPIAMTVPDLKIILLPEIFNKIFSDGQYYGAILLLPWFLVLPVVEIVYRRLLSNNNFKAMYYISFFLLAMSVILLILAADQFKLLFPIVTLSLFLLIPGRITKWYLLICLLFLWLFIISLSFFVLPFTFIVIYGPHYIGFPILDFCNKYLSIKSVPIVAKFIWYSSPILNCFLCLLMSELISFLKSCIVRIFSTDSLCINNKFMNETILILGTIFIGFYLIFSTGMPASVPLSIMQGGWIIILIHYCIISLTTFFILKFVGTKVKSKSNVINAVLWCFFAVVSAVFSLLALANPKYLPEMLVVPICNTIYLSLTCKMYKIYCEIK